MTSEDRICLPTLNLIHRRPRLLNLLAEYLHANKRLITLWAPAGYGKSVLLADFAQTTSLPICWCSFDTTHRDPQVFLTLLTHSIIYRFPALASFGQLEDIAQADIQTQIYRLIDWLTCLGKHIIIFDNYQQANSVATHLVMTNFLEQLPETSTLIIATHERIEFCDSLTSQKIGFLSPQDLQFTSEELQLVIRKQFGHHIGGGVAASLTQETEGQIAQILLAGYMMSNGQPSCPLKHQPDKGQIESEYPLKFLPQTQKNFIQQGGAIAAAEVKICQSTHLRVTGDVGKALRLATEGLEQLLEFKADEQLIAWARWQRGLAYRATGDLESTLADIREALGYFEKSDDDCQVAWCHHDIGTALVTQGYLGSAEYHYEKARYLWQQLENINGLAHTLNGLGTSFYMIGKYAEALKYFQESFKLAQQIKAEQVVASAQAGMGDVYFALAEYTQALEAYQSSLILSREIGIKFLEIYNQIKIGEYFYQKNDLNQALNLACRAREVTTELELYFEKGLASFLLAKIHVSWARYEASFALFEEALACFVKNNVLEQIKVNLWWGYSLLLDLRTSAALKKLQEAIHLILDKGFFYQGLNHTLKEIRLLLLHFFHWGRTPPGIHNVIFLLLKESQNGLDDPNSGMQFFAFGSPTIVINGNRKYFVQRGRTSKMPEVLTYLLLKSKEGGCRWNQVCVAIWPDLPANIASNRFHQHLRRLREAIFGSRDYILVQDDYYLLNPDYYGWCDVVVFEQLYDRISQLPPAEALPLQLELIDLYQGEFLTGFDLKEWAVDYRTKCEIRFIQIVRRTSEYLFKQDLLWKALAVLEKGINQDYFCEDLHCTILRVYARQGLYADMAEHYTQVCEIFEQELSTSPLQVQQLYAQLQEQVE